MDLAKANSSIPFIHALKDVAIEMHFFSSWHSFTSTTNIRIYSPF